MALSTPGTFHTFHLARQLERVGMLAGIHTGYPRFKLGVTGLPKNKIHSFPWLKGPYMAGWVPARPGGFRGVVPPGYRATTWDHFPEN